MTENKPGAPVAMGELEEILRLVLLSAFIKGESALSCVIVANVEAGKTMMMDRFQKNDGVLWLSDATAFGIINAYGKDLQAGTIRHLFIPDFIRVLAHPHETRQQTITFLNGLMEEGVGKMSVGPKNYFVKVPYTCGVVTAIPREVFSDERRGWTKIGFMSRLLPISYDYSTETAREVMLSICDRTYRNYESVKMDFPQRQWEIHLPSVLSRQLVPFSEALAKSEAADRYGFRNQKHLQRLLQASAVERGNVVVDEEDLRRVIRLSRFLNLKYTKV